MELPAVTEIKHKLDGRRLEYPCRACMVEPPGSAVLFYVVDSPWTHDNPPINVLVGTVTLAFYWADRPYNLYHWLTPTGNTIGHYFNVSTNTHISARAVEWDDLELDYWLPPTGFAEFIDEEDIPDNLSPCTWAQIERAKGELLRTAREVASEVSIRSAGFISRYGLLTGPA